MTYLESYKDRIEKEICSLIEQMGPKNQLRDACEYALLGNGKRFRPLIVLALAESLGKNTNVMPAALAVECFHTASLIADDLPCMDNETFRRNRLTLHKKYGESIALLASYSLIATGYELVGKNAKLMPNQAHGNKSCIMALEILSRFAGVRGATSGQFLDLFPPDQLLDTILQIIYRKTVTLFEISFALGWLFGGGDLSLVEELKKCAYHFGIAFQIADDLQDFEEDQKNPLSLNIAVISGIETAQSELDKELKDFSSLIKKLRLHSPIFQILSQQLHSLSGLSKNYT